MSEVICKTFEKLRNLLISGDPDKGINEIQKDKSGE